MDPRLTATQPALPGGARVRVCNKKLAVDSEDPPAGARSLSSAEAKPVYTAPPRPTKPMPSMAYVKAKRKEEGTA